MMQNDKVIKINPNELNEAEQKDIENGIVIHGEKEARFFTSLLLDHYR